MYIPILQDAQSAEQTQTDPFVKVPPLSDNVHRDDTMGKQLLPLADSKPVKHEHEANP